MPKPHLDGAKFDKLKKWGFSDGTVTGSNVAVDDDVNIASKNSKKTWKGAVTSQTADPLIWNASVINTQWNNDWDKTAETVTVTVTNSDGTSNAVDTTSDIP